MSQSPLEDALPPVPDRARDAGRDERRARILDLVRERRIKSQSELAEHLAGHGIHCNQATLSRDLRDMGLLKGPDGYQLPREGALAADDAGLALYGAVQSYLLSAVVAGNLVVLKTPVGAASDSPMCWAPSQATTPCSSPPPACRKPRCSPSACWT
jgi:arginine repressor